MRRVERSTRRNSDYLKKSTRPLAINAPKKSCFFKKLSFSHSSNFFLSSLAFSNASLHHHRHKIWWYFLLRCKRNRSNTHFPRLSTMVCFLSYDMAASILMGSFVSDRTFHFAWCHFSFQHFAITYCALSTEVHTFSLVFMTASSDYFGFKTE